MRERAAPADAALLAFLCVIAATLGVKEENAVLLLCAFLGWGLSGVLVLLGQIQTTLRETSKEINRLRSDTHRLAKEVAEIKKQGAATSLFGRAPPN